VLPTGWTIQSVSLEGVDITDEPHFNDQGRQFAAFWLREGERPTLDLSLASGI
jgi:hypothetical protein